jgi:hypothetical protein
MLKSKICSMQKPISLAWAAIALLVSVSLCQPQVLLGPPAPVLTQRYDTSRTGAYGQEGFGPVVFTPEKQWGLVRKLTVDGVIYAQPLYAPGLTIGNGPHNALIVATARNHLYAFDADSLQLLWETTPCLRPQRSSLSCVAAPPDTSDDDPPVSSSSRLRPPAACRPRTSITAKRKIPPTTSTVSGFNPPR